MKICLRATWLWVRIHLQSLKFQLAHEPGVPWSSANFRIKIHSIWIFYTIKSIILLLWNIWEVSREHSGHLYYYVSIIPDRIGRFQFSYQIGPLFLSDQIFFGMILVTEKEWNTPILKVIRDVIGKLSIRFKYPVVTYLEQWLCFSV